MAKSAKRYPDPQDSGGSNDYNPWLTAEHLGKSGKAGMTILGNDRESSSQYGAGVVVDVRVGNSEYSWTVKFSSGNYSRLHKQFGTPDRWKGKKVNVEVKTHMGREYVAVV